MVYPDKNDLFKSLRLEPPMIMQEIVQVAWKFGLPPDDVLAVVETAYFLREYNYGSHKQT